MAEDVVIQAMRMTLSEEDGWMLYVPKEVLYTLIYFQENNHINIVLLQLFIWTSKNMSI